MKKPITTAVGVEIRSLVGLRTGVLAPGLPVGTADVAEQSSSDEREMQTTAWESWGVGDAGPVQSGDTDAMLNAFNRDTYRGGFGRGQEALARVVWTGIAGDAPKRHRGVIMLTRLTVLQQPGGKARGNCGGEETEETR